jgi:PilZ domain
VYAAVEFNNSGIDRGSAGKDANRVAEETERSLADMSLAHFDEMQSAARFPLHLAASVKTQNNAYVAETENISANGVLLAMDNDVPVGSMVDVTILLPAAVVGARRDVQVDCRGRVVRSFEDRGRRAVGVVIDEYHFERA